MAKVFLVIIGFMAGSISVALCNLYHIAKAAEPEKSNRWEYRVDGRDGYLKPGELQKLGEEGWELIWVDRQGPVAAAYYFKRPK